MIMKKYILGLALVTVAMTSCSDFLEEEPELRQSNEMTFAKYTSMDAAGSALYGMMQSASWYDGAFILESELRCGNAKNPTQMAGSGRYRTQTQWNFNSQSTSAVWAYGYYTIVRANNVINNLAGMNLEGNPQQAADNLKAEALFMRALCHFDIVITYCQPYGYNANEADKVGVPIVLGSDLNGQPARDAKADVYDQIVADLLEAESLISDDFTRSGAEDPKAMVSKGAIQALLSRVYLYMEEWQKAADYATKVINSGKYSLVDAETYASMWDDATGSSEIIFEVYGSDKNGYWDDSGWTHLPYLTATDGSGDICATEDLYSLYEAGDARLALFTDNGKDHMLQKYFGKAGANPRQVNVPILRFAEMYLNRAEAIINGASIAGVSAVSDLRTLATYRNATPADATKEGVFTDRRKELMFEGHIAYDYARCQKNLTRTDFDGLVNKDVPFPSTMWAMPIPRHELDANPNIVQNPGYNN